MAHMATKVHGASRALHAIGAHTSDHVNHGGEKQVLTSTKNSWQALTSSGFL